MIDPDHVNCVISRVLIPPEQWEGKEEAELVTGLHALACMAAYHEWTNLFTFVCLLDGAMLDHVTFGVEETSPADWLEVALTEMVRFHEGAVLAVAVHLGAWSDRDDDGNPTREAKYVITISAAQDNIIVSSMQRDVASGVVDNEGKWDTAILEHVTLDPEGDVKNAVRRIQREIQDQRGKREPNV